MPKVVQNLIGKWDFTQYPLSARKMEDLDAIEWSQARVPSSIFDCLIEADKIEERDLNCDPEKFDYVSEVPWIFRREFDVSEEMRASDRVDLIFEGLDTVATVWLNGALIRKTDNMFISHRIDISRYLKQGRNILMVKFDPAQDYAEKLMERYTTFKDADFAEAYRVYVRKANYQFGADFCPKLVGCGIFGGVYLEGIEKAKLADVHIRTISVSPGYADVKVTVALDIAAEHEFYCRLVLNHGDQTIINNLKFLPGEDSHSVVMQIKNPELWYPAGYGEQNLHQMEVELTADEKVIDSQTKTFGIRSIKLHKKNDKRDFDFHFEVNGQDVRVKGANFVPTSFSPKTSEIESLLSDAFEANFNMIRVWAGGCYQPEIFYEICDRRGILVWQDFMFTGAYYPDGGWFSEKIEDEAKQVITRLRNHPCLAIWCGNDKIDVMHKKGELGKSKKFYSKDIYHNLLPNLIHLLDPDTPYIPTVPLVGTKAGKALAEHKNVWGEHQPVSNYLCGVDEISPFVAEFGMESLPALETVKSFCREDQLRVSSLGLESHNYQPQGNSRIYRYMGDLLGCPENLERFIYYSQVTQARASKMYVEHLRVHRKENHGVLFSQLNDSSPAISCSAIDYSHRRKALYYYAKRFYAPRLAAVVPKFVRKGKDFSTCLESVGVVGVNDHPYFLTAVLKCTLLGLSGDVIDQIDRPVTAGPFEISTAVKLPRSFVSPESPEKSCLYVSLEKDGNKLAENVFLYLPDKYMDWPEPEIRTELSMVGDNEWLLSLNSDVVTKDVELSAESDVCFSDNFLDLVPLSSSKVKITLPGNESSRPAISVRNVIGCSGTGV